MLTEEQGKEFADKLVKHCWKMCNAVFPEIFRIDP